MTVSRNFVTNFSAGRILNYAAIGNGGVTDPFAEVGTDADSLEKILGTYTMPGDTLLLPGSGINILAAGVCSANARVKVMKIKLPNDGSTFIQFTALTYNGGYRMELNVWRVTETQFAYRASGCAQIGAEDVQSTYEDSYFDNPVDFSNDLLITTVGQNDGGANANDIVRQIFTVTLI